MNQLVHFMPFIYVQLTTQLLFRILTLDDSGDIEPRPFSIIFSMSAASYFCPTFRKSGPVAPDKSFA